MPILGNLHAELIALGIDRATKHGEPMPAGSPVLSGYGLQGLTVNPGPNRVAPVPQQIGLPLLEPAARSSARAASRAIEIDRDRDTALAILV